MSASFITINDHFTYLKPYNFDFFMLIFSFITLIILIIIYLKNKDRFNFINYITISSFIIFNISFLPLFIREFSFEIHRFSNISDKEKIKKIEAPEFYNFYELLNEIIKPDETFYFLNPYDTYYKNIYTKYKLTYYLTPRMLANDPNNTNYLIDINYKNNPTKLSLPKNKNVIVYKVSQNLTLLKLTDINHGKFSDDK